MEFEQSRDQQLIQRFKDGEKQAFDELVRLHSQKLFRVAFGFLGNREDAEEVVQDAFLRAYKALGEFRGDASFETWMHRITLNLARNRYHWNKRRGEGVKQSISAPPSGGTADLPEHQDLDLPDRKEQPDLRMEHRELEQNILNGLKRLPDTLREAMILRHMNDCSYERIADLLDCKVGTIKSRLARGRSLLRDYLAEIS